MKMRNIISRILVIATVISIYTVCTGFGTSYVWASDDFEDSYGAEDSYDSSYDASYDEEAVYYEALILDYAGLLTDDEEYELYDYMEMLTEYGNVIFQSVELSQDTDFETYCEDTYYSYYGNEPGVIFQIDMGNRKLTLSASTDMEKLIGKERDTIVDNVYRYATDGDYLGCALRCFEEIYEVVNDGEIAHTMKYIDNAILAIIISLILNFIIVFASNSKKKTTAGEIVAAMAITTAVSGVAITEGKLAKEYKPLSSGSSSSGGGGGFSGGGGGGFSGGSSSHGF